MANRTADTSCVILGGVEPREPERHYKSIWAASREAGIVSLGEARTDKDRRRKDQKQGEGILKTRRSLQNEGNFRKQNKERKKPTRNESE